MTTKTIVALAVVGALAGCSGMPLEADYGRSVDSLIKAQAANPETLTSPSLAVVTGVDPDYANNVVKAFRKDISKPEDIRQPIQMVLMGSSGGSSGGW
jgi:uncharacterized lipoprotein